MTIQENTNKDVVEAISSLSQWSQEHIRSIFESKSDEECIKAIEATFSEDIEATLNGQKLSVDGIKASVLSMRRLAPGGLRVQWQQCVEAPFDTSNRDGAFGGVYFIHGIQRLLPRTTWPTDFVRQKTVTVRIKSQSADMGIDSRKIVNLVFVAADVKVDVKANL